MPTDLMRNEKVNFRCMIGILQAVEMADMRDE
jgi:hypothetical protein